MTGDGVNDAPALKQAEVGVAVSNATDIAKGAASCVLTVEGLSAILSLVKIGRQIHQRIVTWIVNKVIKTFQQAIFIIVAFLITGQFPIDDGKVILLLFLVDFITLSLSTDNVKWSSKPEKWNIPLLMAVGTVLGLLVAAESLAIFYVGILPLDLADNIQETYTYTFDILFFFGISNIFSVRQRSWFWHSTPSIPLGASMVGDIIVVIIISTVGIPTFMTPIPIQDTAVIIVWCFGCSLIVNEIIKVGLYHMLQKITFFKD